MHMTIGTRASRLALAQTEWAARLIRERIPGTGTVLKTIATAGDADRTRPLDRLGTGVFTGALETALLAGEIDLAVHSMKDLPTARDAALAVACVPAREDIRDALVLRRGLAALPARPRIGTGSRRRAVQLRMLFPDAEIVPIRGNVDTRIQKADDGACDAVVLAAAGLRRLGLEGRITAFFEPGRMIPACGQGALALEVRRDRAGLLAALAPLSDPAALAETAAERAFLAGTGGGCHLPVGAFARLEGGVLTLTGLFGDDNGCVTGTQTGPAGGAGEIGRALAARLTEQWEARR